MRTLQTTVAVLVATFAPAGAEPIGETFFEFDSSQLRASAESVLDEVSQVAQENPTANLVIEGHTDEYGSEAYNVGLSARRAETVRDALVERGVPSERIVLALYGEDAPGRESNAAERRVAMSLTADPLYRIIDNRLGVATALVWSEPVTVAELEGPRIEQTARR